MLSMTICWLTQLLSLLSIGVTKVPQKAIFGGFEQFLWGFKGRQSKIHDGAQQSQTSA